MTGLLVLAVILALVWAVDVALNPKAPCRRCEGHRGRHGLSRPKAYGDCGKCGGRGERVRFGAKAVRKAIGRPL